MQDDSNLRWPPKNKMPAKKKYFPINFTCLMHRACLHLPYTSKIAVLFTAIPQYIFISPIHSSEYTALKTLHSHYWWDALPCCYDPNWLNNTFIFLGLQTYLNLWRRFTIFSTECVSGTIKNSKYMCYGLMCSVYGLISVSSCLFLWLLICRLVKVLFLSVVVNF